MTLLFPLNAGPKKGTQPCSSSLFYPLKKWWRLRRAGRREQPGRLHLAFLFCGFPRTWRKSHDPFPFFRQAPALEAMRRALGRFFFSRLSHSLPSQGGYAAANGPLPPFARRAEAAGGAFFLSKTDCKPRKGEGRQSPPWLARIRSDSTAPPSSLLPLPAKV